MATITKPMALDESFNTTETTPRSQADVLAAIESAIRQGFGRNAADVSYDNTTSGLTADDVQEAIDELAAEKVDKVEGKGLSSNDFTDEDKEALDNMELDIAGTQTASGNPITLTDAAPINAESLVVELEPKQDLHGQSAPYVGGAGKNKLDLTDYTGNSYAPYGFATTISGEDVTFTLTNFPLSGATESFEMLMNTDATFDKTGLSVKAFISAGGNYVSGVRWSNIYNNNNIAIDLQNLSQGLNATITMRIMVYDTSSGEPTTYEPYSNICPITGYTECEVDDVGKNLIDIPDVTLESAGDILNDNVNIPPGTYTLSFGKIAQTEMQYELILASGATTLIDEVRYTTSLRTAISFTISESADHIRCYVNGTGTFTDIMLEKGNQATTYEPYHSSNATIQFGQTVYGGSVDFKTGVVTITDANIASYAGETLPSTWISDRDAYSSGGTPTTGAQVVYKLATPTTLQLTPQELKLLQNTNNITTNGTTITLGYQPDNVIGEVKGEIEKCSPNPEFMHFEVNENVVDAIPIIFDEAIHSYTVSGDNWKDKTFLCVECCDMRYGILQLVLSSDMAFVDSCGKALMLYPYMRSIEQYIKITISLGQSYGYEISYQTTSTSSLLDYLKIRVRLFN